MIAVTKQQQNLKKNGVDPVILDTRKNPKSEIINEAKNLDIDIKFSYVVVAAKGYKKVKSAEIAKISDKLGALIASLPLVTFLVLIWLYIEDQDHEKIASHAYYTFWYVLPTLPMLLLFPFLLKNVGFWFAIFLSILFTLVIFLIYAQYLKRFDINLTSF